MITGEANWKKKEWRMAARRARDAVKISEDDYRAASEMFYNEYIAPLKSSPIVALYWPIGNEFDTKLMLQSLSQHKIKTALPRITIDGMGLGFHLWQLGGYA